MRWRNILATLLLLVGLLQMLGDLTGLRILKGLGAATVFAPYPKVFCDVDGLEPFASRFTLLISDGAGVKRELSIDPGRYGQLRGPYNRRNVYGAALSYAPRLPESLWRQVFDYGLKDGGPLRAAFGLAPDERAGVRIETRTRGRKDVWILNSNWPENP